MRKWFVSCKQNLDPCCLFKFRYSTCVCERKRETDGWRQTVKQQHDMKGNYKEQNRLI